MIPCVLCAKNRDEKRDDPAKHVCFGCSNRILRWLRELEEYIPTLSLLKPTTGITEYQTPVFGSRSPANDAVIVHIDPRSATSDRDGVLTCGHMAGDDECTHQRELGALAVVASWAAVVVEEREIAPEGTAFASIALLRRNHSWITEQPWVDEYARELKSVHAAVRALANDPVPRSVGKCINLTAAKECRGQVFEVPKLEALQCSDCRRIYTGTDLIRLKMSWEAS